GEFAPPFVKCCHTHYITSKGQDEPALITLDLVLECNNANSLVLPYTIPVVGESQFSIRRSHACHICRREPHSTRMQNECLTVNEIVFASQAVTVSLCRHKACRVTITKGYCSRPKNIRSEHIALYR